MALVSLSVWYCINIWETSNFVSNQRNRIPHPEALRPYDSEERLPIVVASYLRFFQLAYYWPPELRSRIYYLTSREAALQFEGNDTGGTCCNSTGSLGATQYSTL